MLKYINFNKCNKISFMKEVNQQFENKKFELNLYKYFSTKPENRIIY